VSCGALPESLLESELFGHVKGSFTGAVGTRTASSSRPHRHDLPRRDLLRHAALQVKLLRVLQERQFEPVGSNKTEKVDVRVILASNEDLSKIVQPAGSARISITASTSSCCNCRGFASGSATFPCSPSISSSTTAPSCARRSPASPMRVSTPAALRLARQRARAGERG